MPQLVSMEYEIEDQMMLDREWATGHLETLRQRVNSPEELKTGEQNFYSYFPLNVCLIRNLLHKQI